MRWCKTSHSCRSWIGYGELSAVPLGFVNWDIPVVVCYFVIYWLTSSSLFINSSLTFVACHPTEIIARHKRVLRAYNSGKKLGKACAFAGVTELTVRCKAAIPELAIACSDKFEKLLAGFRKRDKIADFFSKFEYMIQNDAEVRSWSSG